jgi:alpha-tubulin suppressor-like RCC1 family protein
MKNMKQLITLITIFFVVNADAQCWQTISASGGSSIVTQTDGRAWAWGSNSIGQLGNGTTIDSYIPIQSGNETWQTLSEGWNNPYTIAIKTDGTLWLWQNGPSPKVQIGTQNNWSKMAAGGNYTLATKTNGTLWSWGTNMYGVLGNGTTTAQSAPTQVGTASWTWITAGFYHVLGIKSDGTLWAWGSNSQGQLGDGTNLERHSPVQVGTDNNWESVVAGGSFTVAKKTDGTLWSWGSAAGLGVGPSLGVSVPAQIGTDSDWSIITAGQLSVAAIKTDGTLWGWGLNAEGELGTGTFDDSYVPIQIGTDTNWADVDKGLFHTLAKKTDNTLWAWGYNLSGRLGDGTTITRNSPVMISCSGLSIDQPALGFPFLIAPNPAREVLHFESRLDTEIRKVTIADMLGKTVITQYGNIPDVNVEQLTAGMYILLIEANDKSYHQKFIKQ